MKPGDRVRYRFAHRMTGVIVRPVLTRKSGDWVVLWENWRELPAFEENLELELGDKTFVGDGAAPEPAGGAA